MMQKITWQEMKNSYPNEWLLITDFELDRYGNIKTGIVERHSKEMDKIVTPPLVNKNTASRYTGESTFAGLRSHVQHDHAI